MNETQLLLTLGVIALGTMLTRFLPFLLFPAGRPVPKVIGYLGKVLHPAVFGMLVIFCLRNVSVIAYPYGLPELCGIAVVVAAHLVFRRTLLSIAAGTACYMLLLQFVF